MKARDAIKKGEMKTDSLLVKLMGSPYTFPVLIVAGVVALVLVLV